jgi:hypothetical protein
MTTGKLVAWGPAGAECSSQPHLVAPADRPRLSWGTLLSIACPDSLLSTGTAWRRSSGPATPLSVAFPAWDGNARGRSFDISKNNGQLNTLQTVVLVSHTTAEREKNGQASRLISTSQLNASRRFHTWPINLVVYQEPSEGLCPGRSHLVEGFTLRCLQRFSLPNVATRRCHWRDNRYTRGSSNPVLSY